MNCSSESTIQNNSYKLTSSQLVRQNVLYDELPRQSNHFRKKSEVNYNLLINRPSAIDPLSCKSNNISFKQNDSLNTSGRKNEPSGQLSKLEKYFKKQAKPTNSKMTNNVARTDSGRNSLAQSNIYERFSRGLLISSPKTIKERSSFKPVGSFNTGNLISSKTKNPELSKSQGALEQVSLSPLFRIEELLYQFVLRVHKKDDFYNNFKEYIEYVQEQDFERHLVLIEGQAQAETFKNALILERMSFMICFYLSLNGLYKKEIVFIQKIAGLIYSNILLFIEAVMKQLTKSHTNVF